MPKLPTSGSLSGGCNPGTDEASKRGNYFGILTRGWLWSFGSVSCSEVVVVDWIKIRDRAYQWAIAHHKDADDNHRQAFANSVAYLVTGASGGSHGPSLREHLVSWSLMGIGGNVGSVGGLTALYPDNSLPRAGEWEYGKAIAFATPLCFDPPEKYLDKLIQISGQEHCFDDAEVDASALKKR